MPTPIEYRKVMTEMVYIHLPGPSMPEEGMPGTELLHGFLSELARTKDETVRNFIEALCVKWNIHFQEDN